MSEAKGQQSEMTDFWSYWKIDVVLCSPLTYQQKVEIKGITGFLNDSLWFCWIILSLHHLRSI